MWSGTGRGRQRRSGLKRELWRGPEGDKGGENQGEGRRRGGGGGGGLESERMDDKGNRKRRGVEYSRDKRGITKSEKQLE